MDKRNSYHSNNSSSSSSINNNEGCLSTLTKLFIQKAQYAQITKDEALNACSLVLTTYEVLFDSLLQNQILLPASPSRNIYLMNDDISTQAILVNLTSCYSPLCKKSTLPCYSPSCPKFKRKKHAKLYLHQNLLNRTNSDSSKEEEKNWTSNIPRSILENLSPTQEKKRQLAIEELQNYESNFIKQLIVIRDVFAKPLLSCLTTIEEIARRFSFHDTLFGNYHVLANHHKRILRDLEAIRGEHNLYPSSTLIGNILYKHFSTLKDHYIRYVSNHVFAEYQYKLEYQQNPAFVQFIEQQEAMERDFRLTLKGLLLSPIVRMPKYEMLLTTIANNTQEEDRHSLQQCIILTREINHKMNEATRNAETEQRLMEIKFGLKRSNNKRSSSLKAQHQLSQILTEDTTLIHEGSLEWINRIPPITCQVFLFSNVLLITRERPSTEGRMEFTLDKAIPLHMLGIGNPSSSNNSPSSSQQQANILSSIRYQFSSGSSYPYATRRYHSENSGSKQQIVAAAAAAANQQQKDSISIHSADDASSTYSQQVIYTISGLKIRHRIRTIKQRIHKRSKSSSYYRTTVLSPTFATMKQQQQQHQQTMASSPQQRGIMRPRLLQIYHLADPTMTYLFECPSTDTRLIWKNKIRSVLSGDEGIFGLEELVSTSNYSTSLKSVDGRYATGCGTIWCSLPFTTSDGREVIALGTQYGLWVAYRDGSELFKQILPNNCHQLELFDNHILIVRIFKPNRILGAILIDHIYPPAVHQQPPTTTNDTFQILQKSGCISFAVGSLRGEPILCYLRTSRTGSIRLVLMFYRRIIVGDGGSELMFRKFKEYKSISIQPIDLKIIQDTVYIQSRTEGIEKVNLVNLIMGGTYTANNSYRISLPHHISSINNPPVIDDPALTTVAYVPLNQPGTGLICSAETAWPVADANADLLQQEIFFETEAKSVVVHYPYLIIISANVIEVRHLETTALVQAIAGNKIRCVYVSTSDTITPVIHVTMLHADQDQTKLYQLYIKETPQLVD